ncbi:hypothetical protein K523DRAFT_252335 [Schizophyllum commune Tattone D]|nr:hypothetical protein K523DRAFT_252335 [Schizophyllum commune Tattone D]
MASHSPVRNRKPPAPQNPASLQARERSASPSVRDRQARSAKAQSMPIMQGYPSPGGQPSNPSPTMGAGPTIGAAPQFQSNPTQIQRLLPTPPHPPVDQNGVPHPPPPQHSNSMPNVHNARGVIHPIPTRQSYGQAGNDNQHFQMTPGLEADIQRAHDMQQLAYGTAPATSSSFPKESYMKDPAVERLRALERHSPRQGAHSPEPRGHGGSHQGSPSSTKQPTIPPERRGSPAFATPMSSPGEQSAAYRPEYSPNGPSTLSRRNTVTGAPVVETRPMLTISNQQTPPLQTHGRTSDRSLPVQEEDHDRDDDDDDSGSPTPSSDLHPEGNQSRSSGTSRTRRGDESTLIGQDSEKGLTNEDEYTPRSPAQDLPERTPYGPHQHGVDPVRGRARTGATDLLGLQGLDGMVSDPQVNGGSNPSQYMDGRHAPKPQYHTFPAAFDPRTTAARFYTPSTEDGSFLVDGPTAAYLQAILSSPRPDAPIPPTPHSQTAAPSPSPLINVNARAAYEKEPIPFSPIVPAGSPYPYPFTHVRRAPYVAPPDPNHPAAIQEQLARQWQVYAQNNQDAFSTTETTSSTPFQGAGFSPWALLHTTRLLGGRLPPQSVQSSPSHEPIPLPPPPQGVGVRRRRREDEPPVPKVPRKPPPRVASTQPRETSPEPSSSSGEETAGESTAGEQDRFPVQDEGRSWTNTNGQTTPSAPAHAPAPAPTPPPPQEEEDEGDWVDEEDDEEEEDLLELEFHPSYVPNMEKRKRRFDARWDALQQAFQALDRQTDSTMILLCAPSHTTKLQSLSSRAIRRTPALRDGKTLRALRTQFARLATERRRVRTHSRSSSLADRLFAHIASPLTRGDGSGSGSDVTSDMREEDLRRALGTALGSLGALGSIYEQREARFKEELRRTSEERQRVELLMRQALGEGHASATGTARMPS